MIRNGALEASYLGKINKWSRVIKLKLLLDH